MTCLCDSIYPNLHIGPRTEFWGTPQKKHHWPQQKHVLTRKPDAKWSKSWNSNPLIVRTFCSLTFRTPEVFNFKKNYLNDKSNSCFIIMLYKTVCFVFYQCTVCYRPFVILLGVMFVWLTLLSILVCLGKHLFFSYLFRSLEPHHCKKQQIKWTVDLGRSFCFHFVNAKEQKSPLASVALWGDKTTHISLWPFVQHHHQVNTLVNKCYQWTPHVLSES